MFVVKANMMIIVKMKRAMNSEVWPFWLHSLLRRTREILNCRSARVKNPFNSAAGLQHGVMIANSYKGWRRIFLLQEKEKSGLLNLRANALEGGKISLPHFLRGCAVTEHSREMAQCFLNRMERQFRCLEA